MRRPLQGYWLAGILVAACAAALAYAGMARSRSRAAILLPNAAATPDLLDGATHLPSGTYGGTPVPGPLAQDWKQWELVKSRRLLAIAEAWRRLETEDDRAWSLLVHQAVASGSAPDPCLYLESTDRLPDRTHSTAILREALSLDRGNLIARCLLAANQADSAYEGEGTWNEAEITALIGNLEAIAQQLRKGPAGPEEQLAVMALKEHLEGALGTRPEYWQSDSIRTWWESNKNRLSVTAEP